MRHLRVLTWLLLPLLLGLPGCDVAVGVYFATKKKSSHGTTVLAPAIDTTFSISVANLAAGTATDSDIQTAIHNNGGQPTSPVWTLIGNFTRTTEVDLSLFPGTWDSILISANSNQKYLLDSVVVLNASKDPLSSFSTTTNELMLTPTEANSLPDGKTSETDALPGQNAFMFKRFSGPVVPLTRFRVDIWDKNVGPTSGDTAWRKTIANGGEQRSGGMGVLSSAPVDQLYVSARAVGATQDVIEVFQLGPGGTPSGPIVPLEVNVVQVGAPSLEVMSNGDVVAGHSTSAGDIRVRRFNSTLTSTVWDQTISNVGSTSARIEPNSIALDGVNNAIVVGGLDFGLANGGFGHFMQRLAASNGARWTIPPLPPTDVNNTYWRAVVTQGADDIFAAGDLLGALPSTSVDVFVRKTSQSSTGAETWKSLQNGADNLVDCGNAVGVGSGGNIFVGGFITTTAQAKNAVLYKIDPSGAAAGAPWPYVFNGSGNGDDEILSMVVEGNIVYATGYEATATQGKNLFVMKIDTSIIDAGGPLPQPVLWKRTFHGGGDDRGVSLKTTATHVFVSGDTDVGAGDFDIFVWKLLK